MIRRGSVDERSMREISDRPSGLDDPAGVRPLGPGVMLARHPREGEDLLPGAHEDG
jgi:hypothetical protein